MCSTQIELASKSHLSTDTPDNNYSTLVTTKCPRSWYTYDTDMIPVVARIVEGQASVGTVGSVISARNVEGQLQAHVGTLGGAVVVGSMVGSLLSAIIQYVANDFRI